MTRNGLIFYLMIHDLMDLTYLKPRADGTLALPTFPFIYLLHEIGNCIIATFPQAGDLRAGHTNNLIALLLTIKLLSFTN